VLYTAHGSTVEINLTIQDALRPGPQPTRVLVSSPDRDVQQTTLLSPLRRVDIARSANAGGL
jgi:hypothetical protein